jgi:Flp pilus assembly protein TadD
MLLPYPASGQETAATSLDTSPHIQRGIAAMRGQQWKSARSAWESVLRLEPENAAALSNLGKVQYQLAEYEAARGSLEKATTLKPDLADSWLTLGQVYLELKAPMMAVSATTRGVAENPADPRAHNSLAIILKRIGWTNGAEVELQKALDLDPDYTEAHFNLAVMYLERKPPSLEMAGRHYRKARALGAAPDEIVEQQIRGESGVEESEISENEAPEAPVGGASRKAVPPPKPTRATPVDPPEAPAQPSAKKPSPPRKSTPP